jgi:hypothetical protein
MICSQLKQNLETIKTLKSELDLELPRLEQIFKIFKNDNPSTSLRISDNKLKAEFKKDRIELTNKIKSLKSVIDSEIKKAEAELPTKKIEVGKEFNLKFKYRSLEEMIEAGNFNYKDNNINTTNFPDPQEKELLNQVIKLKVKIFDFKKDISSEDVLKELDKEGYRPATLTELLALAEIGPELQEQFPVIALGSVWRRSDVDRSVPCLRVRDSGGRSLDLYWFDDDWRVYCRFLAIRKENI